MDLKELKKLLEEEYAWGNLDAEANKWFIDELLEDFLDILKKKSTLTDVSNCAYCRLYIVGSSNDLIMTAVEFLAERYNYINWMRNRDEISAGTADEWRAKFLKEAKEMEEQQLNKAWQEGAVTAQNDVAKEIEKNYVARVR